MEPVIAVEGEIDREALGLQAALHRAREPPFVFHYQHPHAPSLAYRAVTGPKNIGRRPPGGETGHLGTRGTSQGHHSTAEAT